jgi:predicted tellurium resistance membrane protein TerC
MVELFSTEGLISLATLTFLEVVLGIDNIVFISLIVGRGPQKEQRRIQVIGLVLALVARLGLLLAVGWLIGLQRPLFTIFNFALSFRDLILLAGGLFLIAKSTTEIHSKLEGGGHSEAKNTKILTFGAAIFQIILIDLVFSFDSILTAIGLVENVWIIAIAIIISLIVMLAFVQRINIFINQHPAMKVLAVAFLFMIGTLLVVESLHVHVPKGYVYFAMAFAIIIEVLNMRIRKKSAPATKPPSTLSR